LLEEARSVKGTGNWNEKINEYSFGTGDPDKEILRRKK
jgi:hypothetical protein